ncbi:hypothetical protein SBI_04295 [Streptomyces bingchenggensis BCW-1]|uniref:Uncharacterized protein n=1 Tax=Streptomyces bingchenggensis (strain BCW-1) TaxID=749414 RepID=D7BTH7_STRBB|nr:hypothetical protein SBI_04295 [Streptomyces bingchenggensis BCW-1]
MAEYVYTASHLAEQPEQTLVSYFDSTEPADEGGRA